MSKLSNYSLHASMGKDERMHRLLLLIDSGDIKTIQSAMKRLSLSKATILKYLKELNISLVDGETQGFTPQYNAQTRIIYPF